MYANQSVGLVRKHPHKYFITCPYIALSGYRIDRHTCIGLPIGMDRAVLKAGRAAQPLTEMCLLYAPIMDRGVVV